MFSNRYFIELLQAEAELTAEAFAAMWRGLRDYGPCRRGGFRKIERIWRRTRRIDRAITERLERTLITPLAAEDIRALSTRLNRILESLTEAAWKQSALRSGLVAEPLIEMYERAFHGSKELAGAVSSLPQGASIPQFTLCLRENHRHAKQIQRSSVVDLMVPGADPIEVMLWKHAYELPVAILKQLIDMACNLQRARLKNN